MQKYIHPITYKGVEIRSFENEGKIMYSLFDGNNGGSIGIHDELHDSKIHIDMRDAKNQIRLDILAITLFVLLVIIF